MLMIYNDIFNLKNKKIKQSLKKIKKMK